MRIGPETREAHRDLSELSLKLLDRLTSDPNSAEDLEVATDGAEAWFRVHPYPVQPVPILVDAEKRAELERVSAGLAALVKSVPKRLFQNDPERLAEFFDIENLLQAQMLLEPPDEVANALVRCDLIDTEDGLQLLEINSSAFLGGWEGKMWERELLAQPRIAAMLRERGATPVVDDSAKEIFLHVVDNALRCSIPQDGRFNVAILMPAELDPRFYPREFCNSRFTEALAESGAGLEGEAILCDASVPALEGAEIRAEGRPVHALIKYCSEDTALEVYRAFKAGLTHFYNPPLAFLLGNKQVIALLSEHADSDLFDETERQLLRDHIPWCRQVREGEATYRGRTAPLVELLEDHREEMLLKPGRGARGEGIVFGSEVSGAEWNSAVAAAVADGTWVVQRKVHSRPYLFIDLQDGTWKPHDFIWGLFCCGETYGGGYVRMQPTSPRAAPINLARGATKGFLFTV